jgi:hypothetical protein
MFSPHVPLFKRNAFNPDPNDWAYQRYEDEKRGIVRDYASIDSKQLSLTLTWAAVVFASIGRSVFSLSTDTPFWSFLPWMNK